MLVILDWHGNDSEAIIPFTKGDQECHVGNACYVQSTLGNETRLTINHVPFSVNEMTQISAIGDFCQSY